MQHYGKYGLSQHKSESSLVTQEPSGKFHLTSKFGRYGIGAKSAVFHLGYETTIETLSINSTVINTLVLNTVCVFS